MSIEALPRACPICACSRKRVLFEQRFGELSEGSLLTRYDLVVCEDCGFAFADGIPDQAVFDQHYANMSKYEYAHRGGAESECDTARFTEIAAWIAGEIPSRECRILDVGCGTAGQLAKLRDHGYRHLTGLDPSPRCAELAKQHHRIEVLTGGLFKHDLPRNAFDLIILVGVLEHVSEVARALVGIRDCLSADGLIFAEVPDATAFADWPDAPYQELSIEHINFFSPASLENLLRRAGFSLVKMNRPPRQFTATTVMPSAAGLFRRSTRPTPISPDQSSEPRLLEYIRQSASEEERVADRIDDLMASGEPLIVWGVGTHTLHLMASTNLSKVNIVAFVDVNAKYEGKTLFGRPIVSPRGVTAYPEPILVCSRAFQDDIVRMIRGELNLSNRLITLYEI